MKSGEKNARAGAAAHALVIAADIFD